MVNLIAPVRLPDSAIQPAHFVDDSAYDVLVTGQSTAVYKPDGTLLFVYLHDVLPDALCRVGWDVFKHVRYQSRNRREAAGIDESGRLARRALKRDGTLSRVSYGNKTQRSEVVGYFDRTSRLPFCRLTAFNVEHAERFARTRPLIRAVDRVFAETVPERHAAQLAAANAAPDFRLYGTAFSTITVNRNWRTAVHRDRGDYRAGFGVMSVVEAGSYEGGFLVFPQYRVAVDMRTGGVCLANVHEYHGNTEIVGTPGRFVRLSMVFYLRAKMAECLSVRDELARARDLLK